MSKEYMHPDYSKEHLEHKEKLHQDNFRHIRAFINELKTDITNLGIDPCINRLYELAVKSEWIHQSDFNLKWFIKAYLTEQERELFHLAYREWMISAVEHTIMEEEGLLKEDDEEEE